MSNKLFVRNLSFNANENDVTSAFEPYGTVQEVKIISDRESNRSRGFGFVTFATAEEAQAAIKQLDGTEFMGRDIQVSVAEDRRSDNRSSGGRSEGYRNQRSY